VRLDLANTYILGALFIRRGRAIPRTMAVTAGAVIALAFCAVFGLSHFLARVDDHANRRDLGAEQSSGCIQGSYRYDPVDLGSYENLLLSATCETPQAPPGLRRFPRPGEVYLSPALATLRNTDPRIATRFPTMTGVIGRAGLTGSNELRGLIGVESRPQGTLGVGTFDSFGSNTQASYLASYLRFGQGTLLVLGLFFALLPSAFLIVSCTRLNARIRERQLRLLSTMGLSQGVLQKAMMLEAAALVGLGAVAGLVAAGIVLPRASPHFVAWTAFPGDFVPAWYVWPTVLVLVVAVAMSASWWAVRGPRDDSQGQRRAKIDGSIWRWSLVILGLLAAALATWAQPPTPLVLGGRFISVVGLFVVAGPLCAYLGRRLLTSNDVVVSLAGARLRRPSGTLTRALGALMAGLFVLSVGASTIVGYGENPGKIRQAQTSDGISVVEVRRPDRKVREALSSFAVLSGSDSADGTYSGTLNGSCASIGDVIGDHSLKCPHSIMFAASGYETRPPPGVVATPRALAGPRADNLVGYVLHVTDGSVIGAKDDVVLIPLPTAQSDQLYDRLIGADPGTNVRIQGSERIGGATELVAILSLFRWGALFAVLISIVAVLISLVSLLMDRQPGNNYLQILGTTPGRTAAVALTEVTAASGVCVLLSLFVSWEWALANHSDEQSISSATLAAPFALAFVVLLGAASALIWFTLRAAGVTVVPDRDNLVSAHDTFAAGVGSK
jgi:FtsX-like permease family protein